MALIAAFGWICWELMGLFISGIAGSVKTPEGDEGELRVRLERLLSAPWW
jgi:hypothetical protein